MRVNGRTGRALWRAAPALLALLLLAGCSVAEYRQMLYPNYRPSPPSKQIDAAVAIETSKTWSGPDMDENGAEAIRQLMTEELGALFARPSFQRGGGEEFLLQGVLRYHSVLFGASTIEVTVNLLDRETGATLRSYARRAEDATFAGNVRVRRVVAQMIRNVVEVKEALVAAFDDPAIAAKRRWRPPAEVRTRLAEARAARAQGNYLLALGAVQRAMRSAPSDPAVYGEAGHLLLGLCDADQAMSVLEVGLRLAPDEPGLRERLASAGNQKETQGELPAGAAPAACRAQSLNRGGVALARERRGAEALAQFEEAIRVAPGPLPKAHYNAGLVLEQLGRPQDALTHYVAAAKGFLLPEEEAEALARAVSIAQRARIGVAESADRRYRVGILRAQQKRYKEAIDELEAALGQAPWLVDAYYNLGLVYDFTGAYGEAWRALRIYLQLAPTTPQTGAVKTKIVELEDRLGLLGKTAN